MIILLRTSSFVITSHRINQRPDFLFLMSKKQSSKKTEKIEIEIPEDEKLKKIMDLSGIKPLEQEPEEDNPPHQQITQDNSIAFDDDFQWENNQIHIKPNKKFLGIKKQKTKKPRASQTKKLAPGFVPDIEIDLHGLTRDAALNALENVLLSQRKEKFKNLLIITGRGLNSGEGGGVLKELVWRWLADNRYRKSYRYRIAPAFLGGAGAIIVFFN